MSTENNKAIVHRICEEGFNRKEISAFDELVAPNYMNYDFPMPAPGREGLKQVAAMFSPAFPDQRIVIEFQIGEGDAGGNMKPET